MRKPLSEKLKLLGFYSLGDGVYVKIDLNSINLITLVTTDGVYINNQININEEVFRALQEALIHEGLIEQ